LTLFFEIAPLLTYLLTLTGFTNDDMLFAPFASEANFSTFLIVSDANQSLCVRPSERNEQTIDTAQCGNAANRPGRCRRAPR
jgi:hypothetical protein